jgi:hypothetical protein
MRKRDIDRGLSAAYPLSRAAIDELPLDAADRELVAAIVAEPGQEPVVPTSPRRRTRIARRYGGLAAAGAAACTIFLAVFGTGGGSPGTPAPAYGAELLRLAKISPHILLDPSSWRVAVTEVRQALEGWTEFQQGKELRQDPPPQQAAKFRWHSISLQKRTQEVVSHGAVETGIAPVLGTTAQVYTYPRRVKGVLLATALWDQKGRAFEFRTSVPDMATFERRLADLQWVDRDTWLAALPYPEGPFEVRCTDADGVKKVEVTQTYPSFEELLPGEAPVTCSIRQVD